MPFWLRMLLATFVAIVTSLCALAGTGARAPAQRPREIYQALNALRVDPAQIYPVSDLRLRRDAVNLTFIECTIGFFEAYDGRVTGVVFTAVATQREPAGPAERRSLAHFLGVPLLDQSFSGAYPRFHDGSAEEILIAEEIADRSANDAALSAASFVLACP